VAAMETTQEEVVEDVETVKEVVDTEEFARLSKNLPAILKNFGKLDTLATRVPSRNPKGDKNARFNFL
ncbi:phage capsid protein, partial [Xenorhabdus griffiniae]|nr:phage capsid protein [Xenorhabdus griffiniae]